MIMKKLWWSRRKKDFQIDYFSGTGAGGQHRNKHRNCVRMTDKETGLSTTAQTSRSRKQNLTDAFRRLVKKLLKFYGDKCSDERDIVTTSGETIRTYHECDNRVVDHVTGKKYSYAHTVGRGDISQIVWDKIEHQAKEHLGK